MSKMKFITTGKLTVSDKPKRKKPKHHCYTCKSTEDEKKLEFTEDPYEAEINDNYTKHWFCEDCLKDSAENI